MRPCRWVGCSRRSRLGRRGRCAGGYYATREFDQTIVRASLGCRSRYCPRASCSDGLPATLLARDPRARVRRAAAELLLRAAPQTAERRLLSRCQESDPHAVVAEACAGQARPDVAEVEPATLLIVGRAGDEPTPSAPFAVLWPDGSLRLGAADRRGAVYEPRAARGEVELLPYTGGE